MEPGLLAQVFRAPVGLMPLDGWVQVQSWGGVRVPLLAHSCLAALVRASVTTLDLHCDVLLHEYERKMARSGERMLGGDWDEATLGQLPVVMDPGRLLGSS
eukprot:2754537-Pyramimonas_sp.AAC.1